MCGASRSFSIIAPLKTLVAVQAAALDIPHWTVHYIAPWTDWRPGQEAGLLVNSIAQGTA